VVKEGLYWVSLRWNNCTARDSIKVTFDSIPTFDLGNDTILCEGDSLYLVASANADKYSWQNSSTDSTLKVSKNGTFWVTASRNNCAFTDSITVNFTATPTVHLGIDTGLCEGDTLVLDASLTGANYIWQDNSTDSILKVVNKGLFWVTVIRNNCLASDSINVDFHASPQVDLGPDTVLCNGDTLVLVTSTPGAGYTWQDNSTNSTLKVIKKGLYWVEVSNSYCSSRDSVSVDFDSLPEVRPSGDTTICQGESILLRASSSNASLIWNIDGSTSPELNASLTGWYTITFTNDCGSINDSVWLETKHCECLTYIPNVFTPNNDDINDNFGPFLDCPTINYELIIFNRWGEKLFSTNDFTHYWDGNYLGEPVPESVYFWILTYRSQVSTLKQSKTLSGTLTVLR
jgi:gliding motility-associated-like protein